MDSPAANPLIGWSKEIVPGVLLSKPTMSLSPPPWLGKLMPTNNSAFADMLASANRLTVVRTKRFFTNRGDFLALINLLHLVLAILRWLGCSISSLTLDSHLLNASFFFGFVFFSFIRFA